MKTRLSHRFRRSASLPAWCIGIAVSLLFCEPALAEVVKQFQLTDGTVITGVVVDEGDSGYLVRGPDGRISRVRYSELESVAEIELEEAPAESEPPSLNLLSSEEEPPAESSDQQINLLQDYPPEPVGSINLLGTPAPEPEVGEENRLQEAPEDDADAAEAEQGLAPAPPPNEPPPVQQRDATPATVVTAIPTAGNQVSVYGGSYISPYDFWIHGQAEWRRASKPFALSVGTSTSLGQVSQSLQLSVSAHWITHPTGDHHFEGALGLWLSPNGGQDPNPYPVPYLGYRYQAPEGGLLVRLGTQLLVVPSVSVGWTL